MFRPSLFRSLPFLLLLGFWSSGQASVQAATLTVPAQYATIQAAVNAAANGDSVLVADGTYSGPGNRDIDFSGKNITVTSQHGPAKTIIDCGGFASTDGSGNHRGFYIHSGETGAVINGLTIENGYESNGLGGGIEIANVGLSVQNCIIHNNTAGGGGGVYNDSYTTGMTTLTNCTINGNTASGGGGVYNASAGGPINFTNCTISANSGGGIVNLGGSGTITFTDCTISGNTTAFGINNISGNSGAILLLRCAITSNSNGGVKNQPGSNSSITLTNCTISGNTASGSDGGGVFNVSDQSTDTITLTNCAITGNTANSSGGGIYNENEDGGPISLTNCAITGNTANSGGGIYNFNMGGTGIILTNCTVTGNTGTYGGGVNNFSFSESDAITLTNDIVYGDTGGEVSTDSNSATSALVNYCNVKGGYAGTNNINANPLFVRGSSPYDLHLQSGSPCLGAGTVAGAPTMTLDGRMRPNIPSIGAYEAKPPSTNTTLTSSLNPSVFSQYVTFTATVTGDGETPTGTVIFTIDGTAQTPVTLSNGSVTYSLSTLTIGIHTVTATYTPMGAFTGSTATLTQTVNAVTVPPPTTQILWTNTNGQASVWRVKADGTFTSSVYGPFAGWTARAVSDGPDGTVHLLWTNTNGQASLWNVTATGGFTSHQYGPFAGYAAVSLSTGGDGSSHLLWDNSSGQASLWNVNTTGGTYTHAEYGPYPNWTANAVASGQTVTDLLWTNTNGQAAGYRIAANGNLTSHVFGPYANWAAKALSVGPDDGAHLLWDNSNGTAALWSADFSTGSFASVSYGPFSGWTAKAVATGPDGVTHLLWSHAPDNQASLWSVTGSGFTAKQYGPYAGWTAVTVSAGP